MATISEPRLSEEDFRASWSSLSLSLGPSSCDVGEWGRWIGKVFAVVVLGAK